MDTEQTLKELQECKEEAYCRLSEATSAYESAKKRFEFLKLFYEDTVPAGEIAVINSEAYGSSLTVLTRNYMLDGRTVLFTINEFLASNRDIGYIGQIVDCNVDCNAEAVLYACQFYPRYNADQGFAKEELFDDLLTNYAEWRFDL